MSNPKTDDVASLLRIVADQLEKPDNVTTQEAWAILQQREMDRHAKAKEAVTFHAMPPNGGEQGWIAIWPLEDPIKKPSIK